MTIMEMENLCDISNCKTLDEYAIHQINMWQKLYEDKSNQLFEMECERDITRETLKRLVETLGTHISRTRNSWDRYDVVGFYNFENNPNRKEEQEAYEFISGMFKEYGKNEEEE